MAAFAEVPLVWPQQEASRALPPERASPVLPLQEEACAAPDARPAAEFAAGGRVLVRHDCSAEPLAEPRFVPAVRPDDSPQDELVQVDWAEDG